MSGWNRLFVVIAVCWALVAPFLLMADANGPIERVRNLCTDTAYDLYGTGSSPQLNLPGYEAEARRCLDNYMRDFVSLPKLLGAMVGQGERQLGLVAWGFILIPLALLWIVAWGFGRIGYWVAAGFRR
jgi:hypothetical protein